MSSRFRPYSEYWTPEDASWLGALPAHWSVTRAKNLVLEVDDRSSSGDEEQLSVSHLTGVTLRSEKNVTMFEAESYVGHKLCRPDDLVINTMWAWMGALGVSAKTGVVSPSYNVYRFRRDAPVASRYYDELLRTPRYVAEYVRRSTGIHSSRLRLYPDEFLRMSLVVPPLAEQTQIAKFLDFEIAQIDALIEKQHQLIELLKEKRQAVISHAVTKGLNPDAPMRDSGVEWLGMVPAHWKILPVRHALGIDNGPRFPINRIERADMGGPYPYWGPTGILDYLDHFRYEGERTIIGEDGDHFLKFANWQMTHWATGRFNVNNHAHVVASGPHCSAKWFYYAFLHRDIGADVVAQGVSRLKLTREGLAKLVLAVPPLEEQSVLMARIERVMARVADGLAMAEEQISLLQERRTALISAAVTGKIDVRGWKPPSREPEAEVI